MDDSLIEDLPLARKSVVPGAGFFRAREGPAEERIVAVERAEAVVVADGDADGLGCAALIREARGDVEPETLDYEAFEPPESAVALVPAAPHTLGEALTSVAEHAATDAAVFVCDLCPDDEDDIGALGDLVGGREVRWFDHHQWPADLREQVETAGVDLVVGADGEECSTDVALRSLDADFGERHRALAAVTRDHDLWLREDPRSDDLADYAQWTAPELYVATVRAHGPDLPDPAQAFLAERRREKEALIRKAVERAELRAVAGVTVGFTYGRCSQNEVAETLREQGAEAAVVVKPSGSASIRGTDAFARCHQVAARLGGGGHPKAAGCKPDVYDDVLDYAHHWTTRGATARRVIREAFADTIEAHEGVTAAAVAEATVEEDGSIDDPIAE